MPSYWSLSFRFLDQNSVIIPQFPIRIKWYDHLILLDVIVLITLGEVMKLLIT
jgi:hypothetical protein